MKAVWCVSHSVDSKLRLEGLNRCDCSGCKKGLSRAPSGFPNSGSFQRSALAHPNGISSSDIPCVPCLKLIRILELSPPKVGWDIDANRPTKILAFCDANRGNNAQALTYWSFMKLPIGQSQRKGRMGGPWLSSHSQVRPEADRRP